MNRSQPAALLHPLIPQIETDLSGFTWVGRRVASYYERSQEVKQIFCGGGRRRYLLWGIQGLEELELFVAQLIVGMRMRRTCVEARKLDNVATQS